MNAKLLFLVCIRLLILCVGHAEQVRRKRSSSLSSSWELSEYSREREIFGDDKKKAKDRSNLDSTQEEMLHLMRRMKRRRKLRKYNYEGELFPEREKKIGKRVERLKKGGRRACDSNSHSYSHSSESELTKKKKRKPIRSLESYSNERKVNGKRRPESRRKSREHSVASAESHSAEHTKKKAKKPPDVSLPSHSHSEREKSDGGDSDRDSVEESSQRTKYLSSYEDKILQEYEEIQAILHNRTRPRATAVEGVDDYAIDFFESSTTLPKELMMITDYAELHSKLGIRFATYLDLHNRDRALALSKMLCSTTPQLEEEAEQQQQQQQLHQQQQEQEHHQQPHQDQHQQHEQQQRFEPEMPPQREHAKQHSHENQNRNQKANAKAIYTPPATRKKPKFDEDYHVTRAKTISHNSDSEEAARDKEIYVGRREKERFDKPVRPKHGASSTEEMILKNDKKFRKFFELDSHEPESVAREKERLKTTRTTHLTTSSAELFSKHDKDFRRFFELDSHEPESVAREKARLKTTPTSRRTTSSAELFSKYDKDFRRMLELDSRESDSVKCEKQLSKKTRRPDEEILSDNEYHGQRGKKSAHSKHRGEESKQYEQENENENENENESENENVKSNASPEKRLQDISASRIQKRPPSHEYDSSNATIPPLSHLDAALPFYEEFEGTKNKKIPDKAERLKIFQEMQQDILVEHKKMKGPKINEKLLDPISKKHVFSHPYYKAKAMSKELQKELEKRQRSEKASHRRRKRQIYQNTELATPNTLNCSPFSEMSENKEQHNETSIRTHITSEPRRALHSDPSKPDKMFTTTFHVSQTKRKIKDQTILEYMEGLSTEERRNVEDAYNQYMCDSISKSLIRESGSL